MILTQSDCCLCKIDQRCQKCLDTERGHVGSEGEGSHLKTRREPQEKHSCTHLDPGLLGSGYGAFLLFKLPARCYCVNALQRKCIHIPM